jgi:hypothetical protein
VKAESRKQKAEGRRQKAETRNQKAEDEMNTLMIAPLLLSAFCFLPLESEG